MIHESEWQWLGGANHLIVGDDCLFHLATVIGDHVISTVGDWRPAHKRHGGLLPKAEEIGAGRKFETMVFKAGVPCECGCDARDIDGKSLDFEGYNTAQAAREGHLAMCRKWASQ